MSVDLQIVIPSHKRAADVTTTKTALPPEVCVLCVPEAQAAEYREHNPDVEIVAHPDDIRGLAPKRMWIADRFGDHMQIDDDQKYFVHLEHQTGEPECKLDPWTAYGVLNRLADNARELGVYLFSLSPYPDPRVYDPGMPFKLTGFVIGGKLGWLSPKESGLWIHPQIVAKDDYWLSALNAHLHRVCLVDLRYASKFKPDFKSPGGQAGVRNQDTERRDNRILRETFGGAFQKKNRTTLSKGHSGHEDQITLHVPF